MRSYEVTRYEYDDIPTTSELFVGFKDEVKTLYKKLAYHPQSVYMPLYNEFPRFKHNLGEIYGILVTTNNSLMILNASEVVEFLMDDATNHIKNHGFMAHI